MKSFFKTKRFKALLAVILVLSGFMVYSITTHGTGTIPSSLVSAVAKPFEQFASWISGLADDVFGGFVLTSQLKEQVAQMEEEIRTLREQQVDYYEIKSENEELRQYLDLKKENPRRFHEYTAGISPAVHYERLFRRAVSGVHDGGAGRCDLCIGEQAGGGRSDHLHQRLAAGGKERFAHNRDSAGAAKGCGERRDNTGR